MAIATSTALLVSAAASVIGGAIGAIGAIQQGQAAKNQAAYQTAVYNQQAEQQRQIAARNEADFRQRQARAQASRTALLGASGGDITSGSPLLASEDFAAETAYQALRIRYGGDVMATRLDQQADLARMAGANAQSSSYFRAGASLLSGIGSAANNYGGWGRTGVPLASGGGSINLNSSYAGYDPARIQF